MSGILTKCKSSLLLNLMYYRIFRDSLQKIDQWSGNNPVKLVRGAYLRREPPEKVARSKEETDNMYDSAVREVLTKRSNPMLIATHNHRSVLKAFRLLRQHQVTESEHPRMICFGQLYGMGDDITYGLVRELDDVAFSPSFDIFVVKYIPYGGLSDIMPYLVRRAEENRGILRGSMMERELLYVEVKRRIMRRFGIALNGQ
jgi:proline dehydrogenase